MKNVQKVIPLFAISCMCFIIIGPFSIWVVYQKAAFPGEVAASEIAADESFHPTDHSKTTEIWAYPATTDTSEVRCIKEKDNEEITLQPKNTETVMANIEVTHLLTNDGDYSFFDRLQCQGGGLESIYTSSYLSGETANRYIISLSIATPLLVGAGFILYRRKKH